MNRVRNLEAPRLSHRRAAGVAAVCAGSALLLVNGHPAGVKADTTPQKVTTIFALSPVGIPAPGSPDWAIPVQVRDGVTILGAVPNYVTVAGQGIMPGSTLVNQPEAVYTTYDNTLGGPVGNTSTKTYVLGTDTVGNLLTGNTAAAPALLADASGSSSGSGFPCAYNNSDSRVSAPTKFAAGGTGSNGVYAKYVWEAYVLNHARTDSTGKPTWQIEVCGDGDINPGSSGFSVYLGGMSVAENHNQANAIIGKAGTTGPDASGITQTSTYGFQASANSQALASSISGSVSYTSKSNAYITFGPNNYVGPVHDDNYTNTEMSSFWGWDGCCQTKWPVGTVGQALYEYPESDTQTKQLEGDVYYTTCNGWPQFC